jgi:hypothetical protein
MTQIERAGYATLARAIGPRRADRLADLYRDGVRTPAEAIAYALSARGRRSRHQLEELRNSYSGKRCFVIGNGPSLSATDLAPLRDEYTFGLNRGYLLFDRIGGPTTFLVAVNRHVVEQFGAELLAAPTQKFVSWRARNYVQDREDVTLVRRSRPRTFSSNVATNGAWEGATVTYVAMQLAFHLGFERVILIGVDHSFTTTGTPNKLITATTSDPNHFDPDYFGPGVRWQLPDLNVSEVAYQLAREHFEAHGREIVDATVGGKLTVFPKVNYELIVRNSN